MLVEIVLAAAAVAGPQAQVAAAMQASAAGWNAGSLERFAAIYADDAVYISKEGLVSGRKAIAARYAPSFRAGGNERGRLTFQPLGFRHISPTHELMYARWTLSRADGSGETGMTTLLFERRPAGWRIITDHSS
jgi:uncharacterized protein (TIGR02246 family)